MKPAVENKNLEFKIHIPDDLPHILGDRCRLLQVLRNIIGNAIKFTDNGYIFIEAKREGDYVLIHVEDTGTGISSEELKKIFTKFYQAYTGNDRNNKGTGLGLFICREIIEKHNGKIWAESKLGQGSEFLIKLPGI
jgi:signal transduction histidine kinase